MIAISLHSSKPDPNDLEKTEISYPGYARQEMGDIDLTVRYSGGGIQTISIRNARNIYFPNVKETEELEIRYFVINFDGGAIPMKMIASRKVSSKVLVKHGRKVETKEMPVMLSVIAGDISLSMDYYPDAQIQAPIQDLINRFLKNVVTISAF